MNQQTTRDHRNLWLLLAVTVILVWIVINIIVDDYSARFVYASHWGIWIGCTVFLAEIAAIAAFLMRPSAGWRREPKPMEAMRVWLYPLLIAACILWFSFSNMTQAALFFLPSGTGTKNGVVQKSYDDSMRRSRRQKIAVVQMEDGSTLRLLSHNSIFAPYLHDEIKVNNQCALDKLPRKLALTVTMRTLPFGKAIDRVTSELSCERGW